jgi:predicted transposase/invertase (TIGR01784 family)
MTNDILFKMLFSSHPDLLRRLVAALLGISLDSIERFEITNPEIPPEAYGEKFCRLDISMAVNGQLVAIEVQVANEGDYPERSLYYWARDFSSTLEAGQQYSELPRTVVISIVSFNLFGDYDGFHSEFEAREVNRQTRLTDKLNLQFFELPKLPKTINTGDKLALWLALFAAKTEEDLAEIEALEVPEMEQAINAYRSVSATKEFRELERLRDRAGHNEASALANARREERAKWQDVVADKDAEIARLRAQLGEGK